MNGTLGKGDLEGLYACPTTRRGGKGKGHGTKESSQDIPVQVSLS